jgi:hypothetical protein
VVPRKKMIRKLLNEAAPGRKPLRCCWRFRQHCR